jgi:hypothetical protein
VSVRFGIVMTATGYAVHFFAPQYGYAGRWDSLRVAFEPIHSVDRQLWPDKWEQVQR